MVDVYYNLQTKLFSNILHNQKKNTGQRGGAWRLFLFPQNLIFLTKISIDINSVFSKLKKHFFFFGFIFIFSVIEIQSSEISYKSCIGKQKKTKKSKFILLTFNFTFFLLLLSKKNIAILKWNLNWFVPFEMKTTNCCHLIKLFSQSLLLKKTLIFFGSNSFFYFVIFSLYLFVYFYLSIL